MELAKLGYDIARVKVEAMLSNEGVPVNMAEIVKFPPHNYFEFHAKILVTEEHNNHFVQNHKNSTQKCTDKCIWNICAGISK